MLFVSDIGRFGSLFGGMMMLLVGPLRGTIRPGMTRGYGQATQGGAVEAEFPQ